jgi:hypothetical protein
MSWIAHPICFTTAHGMGSGSALRLSGMTKLWGCWDEQRFAPKLIHHLPKNYFMPLMRA